MYCPSREALELLVAPLLSGPEAESVLGHSLSKSCVDLFCVYFSPFSNREALEPLVACLLGGPEAGSVDGVRAAAVQEMMEDRTGSHILEVRPTLLLHNFSSHALESSESTRDLAVQEKIYGPHRQPRPGLHRLFLHIFYSHAL